jgi:histone chaperone ASF1
MCVRDTAAHRPCSYKQMSLPRSPLPQVVMDNPTTFNNPFQFEITFECLQELDDDLEWKILYVGKAADSAKDLILDEILVGPVPVGVNKFVLQADAPTKDQLEELLGVTVVLVTCSYREREFVRVGYYVSNTLEGYESIDESPPPSSFDLNKVTRQILADKPRVTKFPIPWGDENEKPASDNIVAFQPLESAPQPGPEPEEMEEEEEVEDEDEEEDDEEDEPDGEEAGEVDLNDDE